IEKGVVASGGGANQFVELELHCFAVTVLSVLDEKNHQKRRNRRRGIDDQLPGIAKVKNRPQDRPYDYACQRRSKGCRPSGQARCPARKSLKTSPFASGFFSISFLRIHAVILEQNFH